MESEQGKKLGQRIKAARLALGLTQVALSKMASISTAWLSKIESGYLPSSTVLNKIVQVLPELTLGLADLEGISAGIPKASGLLRPRKSKASLPGPRLSPGQILLELFHVHGEEKTCQAFTLALELYKFEQTMK